MAHPCPRRPVSTLALAALLAGVALAGMAVRVPVAAQDYAACVQEKLANFQAAPEPFASEGEVVCPASTGDPAAPQPQRLDTTSLFTYEVPKGYEIVPGSVEVQVLASDMGRNGPPEINGNRITVPMMCEGKDLGQGQSWHRIRLTGAMRVPISQQTRDEALADCRRCNGRTSC